MTTALVSETLPLNAGTKKKEKSLLHVWRRSKRKNTTVKGNREYKHLISLRTKVQSRREYRQVVTVQAIYLSVALSLVFGFLCIGFAPELLRLYGADEQIVSIGADYLRIVGGASILSFLMATLGSALLGIKDSKSSLHAGICMNVCQLGLNTMLFFVHFGLVEVACATVFSQMVGMCYLIPIVRRKIFLGTQQSWKLDGLILKRLTIQSSSIIAGGLSNEAAMFYYFRIFLPFGPDIYAGSRIVVQIKNFIMPPMVTGLASATIALVGEQYGKRDYRAVMRYCTWGIGLVTFLSVVIWLFQFFCGEWMVRFFTDDPEVLQHAGFMLSMMVIGETFWAIAFVVTGVFKGVSYTKPVFIAVSTSSVLLVSGIWLTSKYNWGWQALYYAESAQYLCQAMILVVWFYSRKWIKRRQLSK
jgi:putative MATE family efflux protein